MELFVIKNIIISCSELEDRSIVWHQTLISIGMTLRPFIKNNFLNENITFKYRFDRDILVDKLCKVVLEQIRRNVVILIFYDMFDHAIYTCDLVAFQSAVDRASVEEFF